MSVLFVSLFFSVAIADDPGPSETCIKSVYDAKPIGAEGFGVWLTRRKACFEEVRASLYSTTEFGKASAELQLQQLILLDEFTNHPSGATVVLVGFDEPWTSLGFKLEFAESVEAGGMLSIEELVVTGDTATATVRRYANGRTTSGYRRKFEKKNGEWNLGDYEDAWVH